MNSIRQQPQYSYVSTLDTGLPLDWEDRDHLIGFRSLPTFSGYSPQGKQIDRLDIREQLAKLNVLVDAPIERYIEHPFWWRRTTLALRSQRPRLNPALPEGHQFKRLAVAELEQGCFCRFLIAHAAEIELTDTQLAYLKVTVNERKNAFYIHAEHLTRTFSAAQLYATTRLLNALHKRIVAGLGGRGELLAVTHCGECTLLTQTPSQQLFERLRHELWFTSFKIWEADSLVVYRFTDGTAAVDYAREDKDPYIGSPYGKEDALTHEQRRDVFLVEYRRRKLLRLID